MPSGKCAFRQSEIKRAMKAFLMTGQQIEAVEIKPDGTVLIRPVNHVDTKTATSEDDLSSLIQKASPNGKASYASR